MPAVAESEGAREAASRSAVAAPIIAEKRKAIRPELSRSDLNWDWTYCLLSEFGSLKDIYVTQKSVC